MFGAAGCSAPLEQPGLIQKCFTHARHSTNLYLKRVTGTCHQAFQLFRMLQKLEVLSSQTGLFCLHSFAFARLVKSVMTTVEPVSAFDNEIEQVHVPLMSTLPCLTHLGFTSRLWILLSA